LGQEHDPPTRRGWTARILRGLGAVLAALWMVVEEYLWNGLTALMRWLGRIPPVRWVEARIARLPPYAAMTLYVLPWLVLLPAKVLGLWLIGSGRAVTGIAVFVLAKVAGTAILARLFTLTKPALLTVGWFLRLYSWFTAWRDRLYAYVRSLRAWQAARAWVARAKAAAARLVGRVRLWWRARLSS
jgi:hypothetical protein